MSNKPIFTVTSGYSKEPVTLCEGHPEKFGWKHICVGHPEMVDQQLAIKKTLEEPTCVCRTERNPDREQYYGLGNHPRQSNNYVKVIVAPALDGSAGKTVITSHTTDAISKGGTVLYVKPRQ